MSESGLWSGMDEIRPITCEVGGALVCMVQLLPGAKLRPSLWLLWGCGVDDQILDGLKQDELNKRFIPHYNFPYSVGEVRPMWGRDVVK